MKYLLGSIVLKLIGWRIDTSINLHKHSNRIVVAAPHTSNMDALIGIMASWKLKLRINFLIKDYYTKFTLGFVFKWAGAIGVNRSQKNNLILTLSKRLKLEKGLNLIITPEGTRSRTKRWKKGFYHIAKELNMPLYLGYLDYKTKTIGIGKIVHLTGDTEKDFIEIEDFYKNINAKYPKEFNYKIS